jgi:hypothetical protein
MSNTNLDGHRSEPIIIDNPPAKLNLLPSGHGNFLSELNPPNALDWQITGRNPIRRIRIEQNRNPVYGTEGLDNTRTVTVHFDVFNLPGANPRRPAGRMEITWNPQTSAVEFRSVRAPQAPQGMLRWQVVANLPQGRIGLAASPLPGPAAPTPDYRIVAIEYAVSPGGTAKRFDTPDNLPAGWPSIRLHLLV